MVVSGVCRGPTSQQQKRTLVYTITVELNGLLVGSVSVGVLDDGFSTSRAMLSVVEKALADLLVAGIVHSVRIEVLVLFPVVTSEVYTLPVRT